MRIFLDTNIIISAMLFPEGIVSKAYYKCLAENDCYISEKTLYELWDVFKRKFSDKIKLLEIFIGISLMTWHKVDDSNIHLDLEDTIRDVKDRLIYRTAKANDCDAIFTGDNDFKENKLLDIKVMTAREILNT